VEQRLDFGMIPRIDIDTSLFVFAAVSTTEAEDIPVILSGRLSLSFSLAIELRRNMKVAVAFIFEAFKRPWRQELGRLKLLKFCQVLRRFVPKLIIGRAGFWKGL